MKDLTLIIKCIFAPLSVSSMIRVFGTILILLLFTTKLSAQFGGGNGTEDNPYLVATSDHLKLIDEPENLDKHYRQVNDIDLSGIDWPPIGTEENPFTGSYDGDYMEIKNLSTNVADHARLNGLFGVADNASFLRIRIIDSNFPHYGGGHYGGLVSWSINSDITDCYFHGSIQFSSALNSRFGGGLTGINDGGTISSSEVHVTSHPGFTDGFGGIAGLNTGVITDSKATIYLIGGDTQGGIAAENKGQIIDSEATGSITHNEEWNVRELGGLVGINHPEGSIHRSNASVEIAANQDSGGLVGKNFGPITESFATGNVYVNAAYGGGLVGGGGNVGSQLSPAGLIKDSYATGNVTVGFTPGSVGGLVGYQINGDIINSYATGDVISNADIGSKNMGGLVGQFVGSSSIIESYATGSVKNGWRSTGGLAGSLNNSQNNPPTIKNSYAEGDVSGDRDVGGLVGWASSRAIILESTAIGSVTGEENVGGLVGTLNLSGKVRDSYAGGSVSGGETVGGLVGNNRGTVERSKATGNVEGVTLVGGLVGWNGFIRSSTGSITPGLIQNSYAHGSISGSESAGGLVGSNTEESQILTSYSTGLVSGTANSVAGFAGVNEGDIEDSYWDTESSAHEMGVGLGNTDGAAGLETEFIVSSAAVQNMPGLDFQQVWSTSASYPRLIWENVATSTLQEQVANSFLLNQNYPNPFNPTTVISYQIPVSSDVHLEVFNMLGQRVATMVNERQNAGHHSVTFDASTLSSGIYLYRIQAGEFRETRKLSLIK